MTKRRMGNKAYIQWPIRLNLLKPRTVWRLGKIFSVTVAERSDIL